MPPETHSLEDNPLYSLLRRKAVQLRGAKHDVGRYIFLADVGSTLLRDVGSIGEIDHTHRRVSGREIIWHFVQRNAAAIDSVVVFSPRREQHVFDRGAMHWSMSYFDRPGLEHDRSGFERLLNELPRPRYEGYQARSLFRQGAYSTSAPGEYLGTSYTSNGSGLMNAKLPARAVLDLLAGRITPQHFASAIGNRPEEKNVFSHWLDMGMTVAGAKFEAGGVDEDDDYLVLTFEDDPAARAIKLGDGEAHARSAPSRGND